MNKTCRLFHDWAEWRRSHTMPFTPYTQVRECKRCGELRARVTGTNIRLQTLETVEKLWRSAHG